jgi:lysophospholipase L1-like esterase
MKKLFLFGDSITYGKWDSDGGWAARLRKYIDLKYNIGKEGSFLVYNFGIPGELAVRMVHRVESELAVRILDPLDEHIVVFAIGTNDSCPNNRIANRQSPEAEFKNAVRKMIELAQGRDCVIRMIGLTPVDPTKSQGLQFTNDQVQKYDGFLSQVAKEKQVRKLELFEELKAKNFENLLADEVHPNDQGHRLMAERIIEFLGV